MAMKPRLCFYVLAAGMLAAGCASAPSPYQYLENWLIREDPVRRFTSHADLIYLQNDLYVDMQMLSAMNLHAKAEVGNGRFNGVARVFSPLVATREDLEMAFDWYFKHYHDEGWPFVFIGEGVGGALLCEYEANHAEELREKGLIASYYTDSSASGFVTDDMVNEIKDAIMRVRYRNQWGREMPEGMLKR